MIDLRPFAPLYNVTTPTTAGACVPGVIVAAANGVSTASAALPGVTSNNNNAQFQIANKTSVWVHVNFGILGAVRAAGLTDLPVAPGSVVIVTVLPEVNAATVYADGAPAGSTSVVFTRGCGS